MRTDVFLCLGQVSDALLSRMNSPQDLIALYFFLILGIESKVFTLNPSGKGFDFNFSVILTVRQDLAKTLRVLRLQTLPPRPALLDIFVG